MTPDTLYFVHVPKTAGRYLVVRALKHELVEGRHLPPGGLYRGNPTGRVHYGGHNVCHSDPRSPIQYFVHDCTQDPEFATSHSFAIVRNPFDLLVSMFTARWPYQPKIHPHTFDDFGDFVRAYCDPEFAWAVPLQKEFLFFQLVNDEGRCAVDTLCRFEHLDDDLEALCAPFGIEPVRADPFRPSLRDRDYRSFYTDDLRERVEAKCARELSQLGYDFDGRCAPLDPAALDFTIPRSAEAA